MKQELPEGFTAAPVDVKGGDFVFLDNDHAVKITWTALPTDSIFTITYKVKSASASGKFQVGGAFSYLEGSTRQIIDIPPSDLQVGDVAPEQVVTATTTPDPVTIPAASPDTTTIQPSITETTKISAAVEVSGSRNVPSTVTAGSSFVVEITVNKSSLKGFARFQDVLPAGCTATEADSKDGTFTFMDQNAKIVWDNMPTEEVLSISYKVNVDANFTGNLMIDGLFSYVENEEPKKFIIPTSITTVTNNNSEAVNTSTPNTTTNDTAATITENKTPATNVPEPNTAVSYKVQIAAGHVQVANTYFSAKYGIREKVSTEMHAGWIKYIVGNFSVYKGARDHRESVKEKGVQGPFVTAYNSGKRITVQEALMISSQQWYR